jgi:hypothetical protein
VVLLIRADRRSAAIVRLVASALVPAPSDLAAMRRVVTTAVTVLVEGAVGRSDLRVLVEQVGGGLVFEGTVPTQRAIAAATIAQVDEMGDVCDWHVVEVVDDRLTVAFGFGVVS